MRRLQWILIVLCFSVTGAVWAGPAEACCETDVTGDGVVDQADFDYCSPLIPPPPPECDFDGDGNVFGPNDMMIMSACWGSTCAAGVPSLTPIGAGVAAGVMVVAGAWVYRRRRDDG